MNVGQVHPFVLSVLNYALAGAARTRFGVR
jgi:hypothetical protein